MARKDGTLDLRIKRTQGAIKEAFFALVEEQDFDHINVKDITDRAMISRNTFYLHYTDKYDLLNKICDDLMRKLFFGVGKQLRIEQRKLDLDIESAARIMRFGANTINEDIDAYRVLLSSSGAELLLKKMGDVIRRAFDLIKDDIDGINDYSVEYIVSGLTGVAKYHVTHGLGDFEEESYEFARLHLGAIIESLQKNKD